MIDAEESVEQKISPMMAQWHACKQFAKEAVLLFRMGDFYEAFYDDATLIAKELELTLTKRHDIFMAGVPFHTVENYIDKLVAKGYRVAVAEQTEDPKLTKGLVKREVVRIVTPGTLLNSSLLSDKANNFFASLTRVGNIFGLAFIDLTTGEFRVIEFDKEEDLLNEVHRLRPSELLTSHRFKEKHVSFFEEIRLSFSCLINLYDDWHFEHQTAHDHLTEHFKVLHLDGFGLKGMVCGINAAGALLQYLKEILCLPTQQIQEVQTYSNSQFMSLDRTTQRNLELAESLQDGSRKNTLLDVLDQTQTPMGARLIRHWVKQPLFSVDEIKNRQDAIQTLFSHPEVLEQVRLALDNVRDLERLMMKINTGYATPRDLVALRFSLEPIPRIKEMLLRIVDLSPMLKEEVMRLDALPQVVGLIAQAIVDEPPVRLGEGRTFREGYHKEMDELRDLSRDSKSWIAQYQNDLRSQTGLKSLKIGYTKVFGYYIEVSKGQAERMPDIFMRRQTLVNAERYVTPELKNYESKVLSAEERIAQYESELFNALRSEIIKFTSPLAKTSQALARLDCLISLAIVARQKGYIRPTVDSSYLIDIQDGRHPVIENACQGSKFIPNDTILDDDKNRLMLITGPNMAGKSTYIRQVALIVIMAQMGSFVPARKAHIGLIDKVFTRIGASDDLSRGHSTFMVEMTETANILHHATSRSLVILDEIGRGTSTYDGISIAWSVAEYLLVTEERMAKTLFATHYWELTKLEEKVPGAINYNVAVHEDGDQIIFLRKIVKGGTDKSYGIHVGRLAGLPLPVIARAKEILVHLEENANRKNAFEPSKPKKVVVKPKKSDNMQMTFFG